MVSISDFWQQARLVHPEFSEELPDAWSFGATPKMADELLDLVLAGTKTGTASSLWDFEHSGKPIPWAGEISVLLDGAGNPRAVIETTSIRIVPFSEVDAEHAHSEGEGDRTLKYWQETHEKFWREHSEDPRGFAYDMPIICERFRLVYTC